MCPEMTRFFPVGNSALELGNLSRRDVDINHRVYPVTEVDRLARAAPSIGPRPMGDDRLPRPVGALFRA
jgi:hypothetical protein